MQRLTARQVFRMENQAFGPAAAVRVCDAAFNPHRSAMQQIAQLCRVICYPDPAALGGVVRVSKYGFSGTVFCI